MAKAASDYYGTETYKPTTVGAGETLIDPATGKVIFVCSFARCKYGSQSIFLRRNEIFYVYSRSVPSN